MATIVYAWELGAGMGHVAVAAPVLARLSAAGHRVAAVVKDVSAAAAAFGDLGLRYYQAPKQSRPPQVAVQPPRTFAHVLHNTVLGHAEGALAAVRAWRWLLDDLKPRLVICDHAPTALLATRETGVARATIGTGFTCPPAVEALPDWRKDLATEPGALARDEAAVLATANETLAVVGGPALEKLTDLYSQVDAELLTTYAELDHFGPRAGAEYHGIWAKDWGERPAWPAAPGKRVFAYLKNSPALAPVIAALAQSGQPTVAYCPDLPPTARGLETATLRLAESPVRMSAAVAECDFAILNGTHTSVAQMLRGGKPVVCVPMFLEQHLTGERVSALGAGLWVRDATVGALTSAIERMTWDGQSFGGAGRFAERYGGADDGAALGRVVEILSRMLAE